MNCFHCGAEVNNGLALCERCRATVLVDLEFIPVYFRNLARWRPGQAGSRAVPGSREPKGVWPALGDPVGRALDEAGANLMGWVRCLVDDRPYLELPDTDDEATTMVALCAFMTEHLTSAATLDWVGEFAISTGHIEANLRHLTERVVPGWYAGACRRCGAATYVVPGLTWVTCGACGVTTYARDHLEVILDEARGWVARPKRLAEAIVALVDTEQSVPKLYTRIRQWAFLESITPIFHIERDYVWSDDLERLVVADVEAGYARYRFGQVLDLALVKDAPRVVKAQAS